MKNPFLFCSGDTGMSSVAVLCSLGEPNKSNHSDSSNAPRDRERSEHTEVCWDYANLKY